MKTKTFFLLMIVMLSSFVLHSQECDKETLNKLQEIYTEYAKSKSATQRAKYCINPDIKLLEKYYDGSFTPKKYGSAYYISKKDIYVLEEVFETESIFGMIERERLIYFKKFGNTFKMDWEASVGYNELSLAKFKALYDTEEHEFRCNVRLGGADEDGFYGFKIYDANFNYILTAYVKKDSKDGKDLIDLFEADESLPLILKLKFKEFYERKYIGNTVHTSSMSLFIITEFVKIGWVK